MSCIAHIVSRTGHPVQRIVLRMPPSFDFRSGQYLEIEHPEGPVPLSIASAPQRLPELHLHYVSAPGSPEAGRVDELLAGGNTLSVLGPTGDVALSPPVERPALIVAGGTGMAQAMSFIEAFTERPPGAPVTLLWCVDHDADFYLRDELEALEVPWLEPVLIADGDRTPSNRGMTWLAEHGGAFAGTNQVVLAGGPGFVYAAYDALLAAGVAPGQMQSDVFSYAPRG